MIVVAYAIDVLVIPTRPVARVSDLNTSELSSLMQSVQQVGKVIEKVYEADGLTIACQVLGFVTISSLALNEQLSHFHRMVVQLVNLCLMSTFTCYRES